SVGLAAAAVVMAFATVTVLNTYNKSIALWTDDALMSAIQKQADATVTDMVLNRDTQRVVFRPVAAGFKGQASVFTSPEWDKARFFCKDIKTSEDKPLRLAVVDADDNVVQVLAEITSDGRLEHKQVDFKPVGKTRLAIVAQPLANQKPEV